MSAQDDEIGEIDDPVAIQIHPVNVPIDEIVIPDGAPANEYVYGA